ncbi:Glycosyltransferase involved in cell wall bisynthesis [Duganella sp. CF402]|uniref:glycosyltransferase n=1 Tax=unclassified Duganella TaxID=2636909 RepID=UPI0008C24728|nr:MULTISPECIES: glycosyltransferase [unclassified Duganella]RZT08683.1 glycosyltransferase involved in cell wall biosynthesis [Duganella sp. BK701]SEL85534.1 Glycosyltransferase involved in cell wall bisynthesis [Duganella sp. CF402]
MRIVIDLQGAQSESRFRGIGRYSLALALGVARNAGQHEIWLLLNGALHASIADLRTAFAGLVPPERICVFDAPTPCAEHAPVHGPRARAGELLREYALAQLQPDAVLVTSLFEGYVDDALVSVGRFDRSGFTAVVQYDLIPFLNPAAYLVQPSQRDYYERKIASLRNAGLLLAISDYSRQEAIDALQLEPQQVVSISTAVDEMFQPADSNAAELAALRARFGVTREMLMYAPGGFDARKNIDGLVTAFSLLPAAVRARHQLLIASKFDQNERRKLEAHALQCGLGADELILTGYVDNDTLIALYRAATLFIFPSKHEGFGLPALEAMACGALVIGANNTSIPEVIGCEEALFDASEPAAIAAKIGEVLSDDALRERLRAHGRLQAKKFSWDHSAQRALRALEAEHAARSAAALPAQVAPAGAKPRIALVSPMPPEKTGVADYTNRVLPTLLPYFDVDLIVNQPTVTLPPETSHVRWYDAAWLRAHADQYAHIVYQFGNSPFHSYMLPLLQDLPGVVVLHDFFLSSMLAYEQINGNMPGAWTRALLHSHGYAAVRDGLQPQGMEAARDLWPCNLEILQQASHVIVHSDYARQLAADWYGPEAGCDWSMAQLPRAVPEVHDRAAARAALGIAPDAFVVCNFGFIGPSKQCLELLQAWLASSLHQDRQCQLIFVGANHGGDYGLSITDTIAAANAQQQVRISGWISDEDYLNYLQAADVGVQLRTTSRGETSGTVLDCLIYQLPTIINANGAMAEFPHDAVWMLPDQFERGELIGALETLRNDNARRAELSRAGFALMGTRNSPERVGRMYYEALARAAERKGRSRPALVQGLLATPGLLTGDEASDDTMLQQLARCIAHAPDPLHPRQLLVDVTTIARHDLKTGIERVVRNQLLELLQLRASGWRVEPVYLSKEDGRYRYRYARNYAAKLLGIEATLAGADPLLDVQAGDVYYSADHAPHAVMEAARDGVYAELRARGVTLNWLVHDLLPVLRPEFFPVGADAVHGAWLHSAAGMADRLICISAAVADELQAWLKAEHAPRIPPLAVLHHGADLVAGASAVAPAASAASTKADALPLLAQLAHTPSFLMVGTIEPRKGHLQALDAFEQLWRDGVEAHLVIVGNEGWKALPASERRTIPAIVNRLSRHPQLGQRLHWLQGLDDGALQQLYRASSCLLQPSEGEGFGLPLIEAASYGMPLLLRDIPVCREVAGDNASYFSGMDGAALARAVQDWLALHADGRHPGSQAMRWNSWRDNAHQLLAIIGGKDAA